VLIDNGRGEVLLQRRGRAKLGGERWDVSAASHVRTGETYETAIGRCVLHELGIEQVVPWQSMVSYVYTERIGDHSENEFCRLFTGRYDGPLRPNPSELDELSWVRLADLVAKVRANPTPYTSWLREAVIRLPIDGIG
jgi:isopentenyldiphosphate isomerase